jgi:hypothetical protein
MQLMVGDRLVDATGEWEVIALPIFAGAGKITRVRVGAWTTSTSSRFGA